MLRFFPSGLFNQTRKVLQISACLLFLATDVVAQNMSLSSSGEHNNSSVPDKESDSQLTYILAGSFTGVTVLLLLVAYCMCGPRDFDCCQRSPQSKESIPLSSNSRSYQAVLS